VNIDRPAWMADGACTGLDPATRNRLFFPPSGGLPPESKLYCNGCPVKALCLEQAVVNGERGVWAGTSERERMRMRRQRGIIVRGQGPNRCGEDRGYTAHIRAGEEACDDCKRAHNLRQAEWKARRLEVVS
jgi:hypothetical protein